MMSLRSEGLLAYVSAWLHMLASTWLFLLTLVILADVLGRGLFNSPLAGTAEIVANSVVAIAFLQLNHSIRMGGMLRAEFLEPYLPRTVTRILETGGCVLGAILFLAIAWGSWEPMVEAWRIGEFAGNDGSIKLPTYPVRTLLVVTCALAAFNYLIMARQSMRVRSDI